MDFAKLIVLLLALYLQICWGSWTFLNPVSYSVSIFCKLGTRNGAAESNVVVVVVVVAGRRLSPVIVLLT